MRTGQLNALKVAKLVREKKPGHYGDGGGLYLAISRWGTASWTFRYRMGGRRGALREMGLGSLDTWDLAKARERARKQRQLRDEGLDPLDERRAEREKKKLEAAKAMTFKACAEAFIKAHRSAWSQRHAAEWPRSLAEYVYPVFGELPVQAVDVGLVLKVLEPFWQTRTVTAGRVRGRIESVLGWATARGYRTTAENPARWRGHLENLLPRGDKVRRVKHLAALPYTQVPEFMAELREQNGVAARTLEFAVLTAARTGEVLGARWDEFDLPNQLWTIPADRTKARKEHRIPLSDAALAIVEQMRAIRSCDFVFPGIKPRQPLSPAVLRILLRRLRPGTTVHGFRSAFRDWCAERTNFPAEVREMALAHAVGSKVEEAYRRGDLFQKRRQLAEAWARFLAMPAPAAEDKGKLVAIGGSR
jgi:integrase